MNIAYVFLNYGCQHPYKPEHPNLVWSWTLKTGKGPRMNEGGMSSLDQRSQEATEGLVVHRRQWDSVFSCSGELDHSKWYCPGWGCKAVSEPSGVKRPGHAWIHLWGIGPGDSDGKESACNVGDPGSIPGLGRCPGGGHGNPSQYSCLENPRDRGAWWAVVHRVTELDTTELTWHACTHTHTGGKKTNWHRLASIYRPFLFLFICFLL